MVAYTPHSPWLPTTCKLAKALSKSTVTHVPPSVRDQSSLTSVLRNGAVSVGVQGRGLSVTFALDSNAISHEEDETTKSADAGPSTARQKIAGLLHQDVRGHAHGQAALPSRTHDFSYKDLFGSDS